MDVEDSLKNQNESDTPDEVLPPSEEKDEGPRYPKRDRKTRFLNLNEQEMAKANTATSVQEALSSQATQALMSIQRILQRTKESETRARQAVKVIAAIQLQDQPAIRAMNAQNLYHKNVFAGLASEMKNLTN